MCVDHINNNSLDNRKANLRLATPAQNARNRRKMATKTSSKYKGVSYHSGQKKWCAAIRVDGQYKYFGLFKNEIDAAKAYDKAARKHHKEFAVLNFPSWSAAKAGACPALDGIKLQSFIIRTSRFWIFRLHKTAKAGVYPAGSKIRHDFLTERNKAAKKHHGKFACLNFE
jgi:hypothetical protein